MAAHGAQKLFGWFGGRGFEGAVPMALRQRLRPAPFWAVMAGLTELSGVLITIGLLRAARHALATTASGPAGNRLRKLQVTVRPGRQLAKVSFSQPNANGRPPR